jgi:hypothetical protein
MRRRRSLSTPSSSPRRSSCIMPASTTALTPVRSVALCFACFFFHSFSCSFVRLGEEFLQRVVNACSFIKENIDNGHSVIVHCQVTTASRFVENSSFIVVGAVAVRSKHIARSFASASIRDGLLGCSVIIALLSQNNNEFIKNKIDVVAI